MPRYHHERERLFTQLFRGLQTVAPYVSTALIGILVLYALLWNAAKARRRSRRAGQGSHKEPPVPPALPVLGHWLALRARGRGAADPGDAHLRTLRRWAEAYGGAFTLLMPRAWLLPGGLGLGLGGGGGPAAGEVVVLSDPAAVHALLALGEDVAPKSAAHYRTLEQLLHSPPAPSLLTSTAAAQWRAARRSLLFAFSANELWEDFEVAKAKALSLASVVLGLGPGVVLDVDEAALRLSLDVAGLSKLGYDFRAVESSGQVMLLRLLGEVAEEWDARRRRLLPAWAAPWLLDSAAEANSKCRILQDFIEGELWEDIASRGPPPPDDITLAAQVVRLNHSLSRGAGAASRSPSGGDGLDRTLSELAAQLLLAHEPVGHSLAWALGCLARNRAAQDKLVAELKREGVYDAPHTALTRDMLHRLPYLDCVVREALRLYPAQPCPATVRQVNKDVVLGGWAVPAGAQVWVDVYSMHRSPALWREPDRFNPERWAAHVAQRADAAAAAAAAAAEAEAEAGAGGGAGGAKGGGKNKAKKSGGAGGGAGAGAGDYDGMNTVEPDPTDVAAIDPDADDGGAEAQAEERKERGAASASAASAAAAAATASSASSAGVGGASGEEAAPPPLCSPLALMPFGSGPRSCLGQQLAVAELKAALAVLLCFVSLEPTGDPADEPRPAAGLFLRPAGGLHLQVVHRPRGQAQQGRQR
ncbi:hypothetical protein HYH02_009913 [Chlamydomonas schloesseri]|uniref:Cytochrome P450 n=1 Tax=Chlamydomonas schloesseri TaxID=2026947 RepID=A0A835TNY9_9CHLO|nr:hypothetical protein HYH02_009913 [Chlamydomonas schloesseri]|eukprot:KAG2441320.1 hypothetical protein HYH02_009913 [Chlamydomonas schloesseri]